MLSCLETFGLLLNYLDFLCCLWEHLIKVLNVLCHSWALNFISKFLFLDMHILVTYIYYLQCQNIYIPSKIYLRNLWSPKIPKNYCNVYTQPERYFISNLTDNKGRFLITQINKNNTVTTDFWRNHSLFFQQRCI